MITNGTGSQQSGQEMRSGAWAKGLVLQSRKTHPLGVGDKVNLGIEGSDSVGKERYIYPFDSY